MFEESYQKIWAPRQDSNLGPSDVAILACKLDFWNSEIKNKEEMDSYKVKSWKMWHGQMLKIVKVWLSRDTVNARMQGINELRGR